MDLFTPDILSPVALDSQEICSCLFMHRDMFSGFQTHLDCSVRHQAMQRPAMDIQASESRFPIESQGHVLCYFSSCESNYQAMHHNVPERRSRLSSLQHRMPARVLRSKGSASVRDGSLCTEQHEFVLTLCI